MTRRAAVDVGTNSLRLLVLDHDGTTPLTRELAIVRLGADVDRDGRLADAAVARTLAQLRTYRERWQELGVADEDVRLGATSAVRDAANRADLLDAVRELAPGIDVTVLSGEQEAANAFRGAAAALPDLLRPLLVLDVGGGSTELVVGDVDDRVVAAVSLQLGSVRLTERYLASDPPSAAEVLAAVAEVRARVEEGLAALGPAAREVATLVGVAGTVTTLAALVREAGPWQDGAVHGARLPATELVEWSHELLVLDRAGVAAHPEVQDGREDVLPAGALIVRGVVDALRVDGMVASEADGLDALALPAPP